METPKEKIRRFMEETFLFEFNEDVSEKSDLFKQGIIDSFGYVQLIRFLEQEFALEFSEDEVMSNVLVSFENIVECVSEKTQEGTRTVEMP